MTEELNTHGVMVDFGKHKGQLLTRVPVGYIRWMMNQEGLPDRWKALAKAEMERRGDTTPTVELSGHAIDNASLRVLRTWHESRRDEEGIYSWLSRMTLEALEHGEKQGDKIAYKGMKLVVRQGAEFPTLVTIMR